MCRIKDNSMIFVSQLVKKVVIIVMEKSQESES